MRLQLVAIALGIALLGCESKKHDPAPSSAATQAGTSKNVDKRPRARLTDITSATKLDAVRAAFNAHEGEARFLTLLSPT